MRLFALLCWLVYAACGSPATAASGENAIAVIIAAGQNKRVDIAQLEQIYKRKKSFWPDGNRIQPINLPVANRARRDFSLAVLGATPEEFEQYWNDQYFHGVVPPYVLSSNEAVLRFVSEHPNAIGYVAYCSVAGRAKILLVIGAGGRVGEDSANLQCGH